VLLARILTAAPSQGPRAGARARAAAGGSGSGYALSVAELVVSVSDECGRIACEGPSRGFVVSGGRADLRLEVRWRALDGEPRGRLLFDSGGVWRAYDDGDDLVIRCHDARHPQSPYKEARLFRGSARGEVGLDPRLVTGDGPADPLEFPLDELVFQHLLRIHGGIELHAAGVVAPSGRGYVFTGQSGHGKTTTARLWQDRGATVLSDDRVILRRDVLGAWRMHGTPWHGEAELAANASAPLAGVFVLARGERNEIEPLGPGVATATLLARAFPAFFERESTAGLLAQLETLVADVPCRRFRFVPGGDAVSYILEQAA
jgi:hypothetical protein